MLPAGEYELDNCGDEILHTDCDSCQFAAFSNNGGLSPFRAILYFVLKLVLVFSYS